MKKKLPIFALSALLLVGIASCGNKTDNTTSGDDPASVVQPSTDVDQPSNGTSNDPVSVAPTITVDSVTISGDETASVDLNVLGGTKTKLKATVSGSQSGLKVNWSSSDESVATVANGVVKFANVAESKQVTITATSRDDETKSASLTFSVATSPFDLTKSHATNLDTSVFFEEGIISHGVGQDNALVFNNIYGTKFYVEATISLDETADPNGYPKYGIMTGTSDEGYHTDAASGIKTLFYYVDSQDNSKNSGWTALGLVGQNDELSDWNWGKQVANFNVSNDHKVEMETEFRMGLLRDGEDYYCFAGKDDELVAYKHGTYSKIGADEATYAWLGGFNTAASVSNVVALSGDEVDAMYAEPTVLKVSANDAVVFLEESYQINVSTDRVNFDKNKVTFESSDTELLTVDAKGLVTANATKTGNATVTVSYGELSQEIKFLVTDDPAEKVVIDGRMDDALWSENVKGNKMTLKLNGEGEHIDFYASRNQQGIYVFADYYVAKQKNGNAHNDWWENDNYESYIHGENGSCITSIGGASPAGQIWHSGNNTSIVDKFARTISDKDETTGLYHITFESFMSYGTFPEGTNKDTILGLRWGANPDSGWRNCAWWGSNTIGEFAKITVDGLVFHNAELEAHYCPTGEHNWSSWYSLVDKTCLEDGQSERYCKACGKREQKVDESDGEHTYWTKYDGEHLEIITDSTCKTNGSYKTSCKNCGEKLDTVYTDLPLYHVSNLNQNLESTKHEGHWVADEEDVYGGYWDCCGTSHKEPILNETKKNDAGWENRSYWTELATGLVGDFEFNAEYEFTTGMGWGKTDGNQWQHALFVVTDGDTSHWANGAAYGDNAMFRMDWCGFLHDRNGDGKLLASSTEEGVASLDGGQCWTKGNWLEDLRSVIDGGSCKVNVKRVSDTLTITYEFTGVDGTVYTGYVQKLNGLNTNILDFSLSAEVASFTLNKVRLVAPTVSE